MAQADLDLVRRVFDGTNERAWADVLACYAEDIVLRLHGFEAAGLDEGAVGKEAVAAWFADWFRTFDRDYRFEIHELRDLGAGQVLLDATHHARGRSGGVPLATRAGWIYVIRDGQVVRCDAYRTVELAKAAAGIS